MCWCNSQLLICGGLFRYYYCVLLLILLILFENYGEEFGIFIIKNNLNYIVPSHLISSHLLVLYFVLISYNKTFKN